MITDFHTHAFADAIAARAMEKLAAASGQTPYYDGTVSGLRRKMKASGVDLSVVAPVATKPTQCRTINAWAAENSGDGLVFLASLHPDCEDCKEIIASAAADGLKGVKLHPDYQGFYPDEERMKPIYDEIFSRGMFLLFHSGEDIGLPPPVHLTPDRAVKVVKAFPGAKIVFAHLGGFRLYKEFVAAFKEAFPEGVPDGVYIDTSMGANYYDAADFAAALGLMGPSHILFGTDGPWGDATHELAVLKERVFAAGADETVYKKITGENALALIGDRIN